MAIVVKKRIINKNEDQEWMIDIGDIAHAECVITYDRHINLRTRSVKTNGSCKIQTLWTKIEHRGKGYATQILKTIFLLCKQNNVKVIELDDCSDNYRKPDNIYVKNGFKYTTLSHHEMRLTIN